MNEFKKNAYNARMKMADGRQKKILHSFVHGEKRIEFSREN
jgi:hypothetical protein